jgi:hypothetical protein
MTDADVAPPTEQAADALIVERALALVEDGTTDMSDSILRVPLSHYSGPSLFERERAEILGLG